MSIQLKKCSVCGLLKPISEFSKNKSAKDGTHSSCKACDHEYYLKNKERLNKQTVVWRKENPEKAREACRRYHARHAEKIRARQKTYRDSHRDLILARCNNRLPEQKKAGKKAWDKYHSESYDRQYNFHHWSYDKLYWVDIIRLSKSIHNRLHKIIKYDVDSKCFFGNGKLLDTRQKHIEFIVSLYGDDALEFEKLSK